MTTCPHCGAENRAGARFCDSCGAPLEAPPAAREQRKTVTVLFCDVTGSTALGESTDPEALRSLLARYFERMKGIVEAHGGTVEKFIGDAVMAVFGVPQVHEDDALRAARAALEMRDAFPELELQARIGLNTGEVVTGTAERLATGDAVNVAARLEQAASPGEILIGEETLRLVRDSAQVEAVEPLELKGKGEPVAAFRLRDLAGEVERPLEAPMVGRETELRRLHDAYEQALRNRSCQLFTILGSAGVGKSRLVHEFLSGLDANVVRGRCLSYGEGITYWPVVEVLKQLDALPTDATAAAALAALVGESDTSSTADEIAWAFRKLLEESAHEDPLVVVFDDLHWGEETFLDLVEHVADLTRDAPILLLCMARPELLDRRAGWGGGKLNATTVLLEPLDGAETEALLESLGVGLDGELRSRIRDAAEGNPLFVEEMLALVRQSGGGTLEVPPTIQALLAARLDQLDPAERGVLERGAVEGRVFHHGAVNALSNGDAEIPQRLLALVRKELVRPDRSRVSGDDAYRFRHLLIRDAAYDGLPKAVRAELHERFASWLEERAQDLVELDEVLGHHLEQAVLYRRELGGDAPALAENAGRRLGAAGLRALWRGDHRAAVSLLRRALELLRPLTYDVHLEVALARAHSFQYEEARAAEIAEAVADRAAAAGDVPGEALARVVAAQSRANVAAEPDFDDLEIRARTALPLLEEVDDHFGLIHVWMTFATLALLRGQFEEDARAKEQALRHARLAGQHPTHLFGLEAPLVHGPRPADHALQMLDELMPENPAPGLELGRARLLALLAHFDEAREVARAGAERLRELTGDDRAELVLAEIAIVEGDHATAERLLRRQCRHLEARGLLAFLSTYLPALGLELCRLGRHDEAEAPAATGRELADESDVASQALWRAVFAHVRSNEGEHAEAERLAREAVSIVDGTDGLTSQGDARADLAEVLAAAGRTEEAEQVFSEALERFDRKKNLARAAQVRRQLEELRAQQRT